MDVAKLFEDSLKYPSKDWGKILGLGALTIISLIFYYIPYIFSGISSLTPSFEVFNTITTIIISIVFGLLYLIMTIIISGYQLSIIRKTIEFEDKVPDFDWGKNLFDGCKRLALGIVYYIIPFIATIVVFGLSSILSYGTNNPLVGFIAVAMGVLFVAILFIISSLLLNIATAILAETDSLSTAINVKYVWDKIGEIGWGNYIIWIIVLLLILLAIGVILFIIFFVLGILLGITMGIGGSEFLEAMTSMLMIIIFGLYTLVFIPYLGMFQSRAIGLLYNESKK